MPYIQTRTNASVNEEQQKVITKRLGEAITILGKNEQWLMLEYVPECNLYFQGNNDDYIAYVDIKIYGSTTKDNYNRMTKAVSDILNEELNISPSNIYISYSEFENWGFNGQNF